MLVRRNISNNMDQMRLKHLFFILNFVVSVSSPTLSYSQDERYTINPFVVGGTSKPAGLNNQYGNSDTSQKLYDSEGNFRGNLNSNQFDPDSVSNPYGKYGSQYSPESIKNPYGAGSKYDSDSPYNPYGQGMEIRE